MRQRKLREVRHKRIRKRLFGTKERPRLCVFRSNKHIYAQIIDDQQEETLGAVSTLSKEFKDRGIKSSTKEAAGVIGEIIAVQLKAKNIDKVCFDRGGYKYHGKIKALAEGARKGGLGF